MKNALKMAVVGLVLSVAASPAQAAMDIYGSTRIAVFYENQSKEMSADGKSDTDLKKFENQDNSRIGFRFSDGQIAGHIEIGVGPTIETRLAYGTNKVKNGTGMAGLNEAPWSYLMPMVWNNDLGSAGFTTYSDRRAQLRFTLNNGMYFTALDPNVIPGVDGAGGNNKVLLPQLNMGYENKKINTGGIVHFYDVNDTRVTSFLIYILSRLEVDEAKININAHFGQNATFLAPVAGKAALAAATPPVIPPATPPPTEGPEGRLGSMDVGGENVLNFGVTADINLFGVNAGIGYSMDKVSAGGTKPDGELLLFANYPMTLVKGHTFTPELGHINHLAGSDGVKQGMETLLGCKYQFSF